MSLESSSADILKLVEDLKAKLADVQGKPAKKSDGGKTLPELQVLRDSMASEGLDTAAIDAKIAEKQSFKLGASGGPQIDIYWPFTNLFVFLKHELGIPALTRVVII